MSRATVGLILLIFLACAMSTACASDGDDITQRVETARTAFAEENDAVRAEILKDIDVKIEAERDKAKPNLDRIKTLKNEREELEEEGKFPWAN